MTGYDAYAIVADLFARENIGEFTIASVLTSYESIKRDIADRARDRSPLFLGICGAQGSGKSTLALVLQRLLEADGLATCQFSLDDIYKTLADRQGMADDIHPLLRTRGVPGTHDVALGLETLAALKRADGGSRTPIPSFDKAADDRRPASEWPAYHGKPSIILLEGWCVGARAEDEAVLISPVNALERNEDPDAIWRCVVNDRLAGEYQLLFGELDMLILLQAPSFEAVFDWRKEQERKLRQSIRKQGRSDASGVMDDEQLDRFIRHYERLTRHILKEMPGRADICVSLGADRTIRAIERKQN